TELCLPLAIEYYKMSAMRGNVWGMIQLARRYQAGIGTPKNIDKAIFWYQKALEIGCEKAKTELDNLISSPSSFSSMTSLRCGIISKNAIKKRHQAFQI
ncbi:886_t:CDS:1, partial [Cetraspora pellucida]